MTNWTPIEWLNAQAWQSAMIAHIINTQTPCAQLKRNVAFGISPILGMMDAFWHSTVIWMVRSKVLMFGSDAWMEIRVTMEETDMLLSSTFKPCMSHSSIRNPSSLLMPLTSSSRALKRKLGINGQLVVLTVRIKSFWVRQHWTRTQREESSQLELLTTLLRAPTARLTLSTRQFGNRTPIASEMSRESISISFDQIKFI